MLDRLMGAMIAITVALASSSVAFAQNGKQGPQKAKAPTASNKPASNKPFDAHDLSGFWDITNIGRPRWRPERNEQQSAADDAVGFGKVSQDQDGIRWQGIRQRSLPERKRLERSCPVV